MIVMLPGARRSAANEQHIRILPADIIDVSCMPCLHVVVNLLVVNDLQETATFACFTCPTSTTVDA